MNKYILRTILIGDSYVGKSNILEQLCYNKFSENSSSTLGIDFPISSSNLFLYGS